MGQLTGGVALVTGASKGIGAVAGGNPPPNSVVYAATKSAVDAASRSLAKEVGPRRIRVNSINRGGT